MQFLPYKSTLDELLQLRTATWASAAKNDVCDCDNITTTMRVPAAERATRQERVPNNTTAMCDCDSAATMRAAVIAMCNRNGTASVTATATAMCVSLA